MINSSESFVNLKLKIIFKCINDENFRIKRRKFQIELIPEWMIRISKINNHDSLNATGVYSL